MKYVKAYSRRSLAVVATAMAVLFLILAAAGYWGLTPLTEKALVTPGPGQIQAAHTALAQDVIRLGRSLKTFFIPGLAVLLGVTGMLMWSALRRPPSVMAPNMRVAAPQRQTGSVPNGLQPKEPADSAQRLFLHMLAVMQREGRLIDFLAEDLDNFEDAQIGAAVRAVQASCKQVLEKYVAPQAVVATAEGESYTVEPGFNPNAVKLTGHVQGEPPFTGIVRHRGWQASRMELPILTGSADVSIIAPAEIEIA